MCIPDWFSTVGLRLEELCILRACAVTNNYTCTAPLTDKLSPDSSDWKIISQSQVQHNSPKRAKIYFPQLPLNLKTFCSFWTNWTEELKCETYILVMDSRTSRIIIKYHCQSTRDWFLMNKTGTCMLPFPLHLEHAVEDPGSQRGAPPTLFRYLLVTPYSASAESDNDNVNSQSQNQNCLREIPIPNSSGTVMAFLNWKWTFKCQKSILPRLQKSGILR